MCNAGDRPLRHNPDLGVLAMEVIVSWSNVEKFLLDTYLLLMGGHNALAAAAFLALESQGSKTAMLMAVASKILQPNMLKLLKAIIAISKSRQKGRDKLAHWIWGYSYDIKNGLLLADPREMIPFNRDAIFVYVQADFQKMIEENDQLCSFGRMFELVFTDHVSNKNNAIFDMLCSQPEIREKLDRQA